MQIIFVSNSPELAKNILFTNNFFSIIYIRQPYIFSNTMLGNKNVKLKSNDGLVRIA